MKQKIILIFAIAVLIAACSNDKNKSDAYGNFEAIETIISSEASGKLLFFNIEEGQTLDSGKIVGVVDTTQIYLKKVQLQASRNAIGTKFSSVIAQANVLEEQKKAALKDKERIDNMLKSGAATPKQADDAASRVDVINKQIDQIMVQNGTIISEIKSIDAQIAQIKDMLGKSVIVNPVNGTVLNKFVEPNELVVAGKPLYKIADLNNIILRVYVSGAQLAKIKIGQKVKALIDEGSDSFKEYIGEISWISSKTEFTPKIIQTKEERVSMVYAVKVLVKNDGAMKIGMPGEVRF